MAIAPTKFGTPGTLIKPKLGVPGPLSGYVDAVNAFKPSSLPAQYQGAFKPPPSTGAGAGARTANRPAASTDPWASIVALARSAIQSPTDITKMATTQAIARENATLAAQKAASDKVIAQYNDQSARAQGFARALATAQAGAYGNAEDTYNRAANTLQGLGAGLTGAAGAVYQTAVDQTRAEIARITGGNENVVAPAAGDITNASQYANVTIPGGTLAADAANAARLAAGDVTARSERIANIARNYTSQADQAIAQAADDARALVAQRPQTINDLINTLTQNRQTGIQNLASILSSKASYGLQKQQLKQTAAAQAESKRQFNVTQHAKAAQQIIDNANKTRELGQGDRQLDISEQGVLGTLRNQSAAITGFDPLTKLPTFDREQWMTQSEENRKTYAANLANIYHYEIDPATGTAKMRNGHVVPLAGYKVNPKDPGSVIVDPKQVGTGSTKTREVDLTLSDRFGYLVDSSGRPFFNKKGDPVKTPGPKAKQPPPMTLAERQTMMSTIASTARGLAEGSTDADGKTTDPTDVKDAWTFMVQNGFAQNPEMAKLAISALRTAYAKKNPDWSVTQLNAALFPTKENLAALKKEQAKAQAAEDKAKKAPGEYGDPRFAVGKKWDAKVDPVKSYTSWGDIKTKSGHFVRGNVKDGYLYVE